MITRTQLLKDLCLQTKELQKIEADLAITPKIGGKGNKEAIYTDYEAVRIKSLVFWAEDNHSKKSLEWKVTNLLFILSCLANNSILLTAEELGEILNLNISEFKGFDRFKFNQFVFNSAFKSDYSQYWTINLRECATTPYSINFKISCTNS